MEDLKFKCTNLSELRDEKIYDDLKKDTQREYLLYLFLYNIIKIYVNYYIKHIYSIVNDLTKLNNDKLDELYKINDTFKEYKKNEMDGFLKYINQGNNLIVLNNYRWVINGYFDENEKYILIIDDRDYYDKIFEIYDDEFNSKFIIEQLCNINLTDDQYYDIILYFIKKKKYLELIADPIYNSRSIIIKNYYEYNAHMSGNHNNILVLKNSKGVDYININNSNKIYYDFDNKFKQDIKDKNFNDGYSFYWQDQYNQVDWKYDRANNDLINDCIKYLVEILDKDSNQIISMTVTKANNTDDEYFNDKQIHYYIKKNLITQIKDIITNTSHRELSILLHSFAAWNFNATVIYSSLMSSMVDIFKNNNINITYLSNYNDKMSRIFCIKSVNNKIIVDDIFKMKWLNMELYKLILPNKNIELFISLNKPITPNENIKLYIPKLIINKYIKTKYLKYKTKYLKLKKII